LQHIFSVWQEFSKRLKGAERVLLLCDYDGTLTPITEKPELADLSENTRQLLQALTRQKHFTVSVISGRALADLRQMVGIDGIIYVGNHGLEIEGPGVALVNPLADEMKPVFRMINQALNKALASIKGVRVEDKGLTVSLHYRMVEESKSEEVKNIFERVIASAGSQGKFRVTSGKKVYEVRPAVDWDKGEAIALLIDRYGMANTKQQLLPIFLGDDQTDEDGFKVIEKHGGVSIFVGEKPGHSAARYYLKSPAEVEQFLERLIDSVSDRQA
jgi:trehalose 6-phosphate phosphatase